MRRSTDNYCFACGGENPIGLRLKIEERDGGSYFQTTLPREYQGWSDLIHGGIVCTLLDEVMVWAASLKGIDTVTAEITVRFKNPTPVGSSLVGKGRITGMRGKVIFTEGELFADDQIVALGRAKLVRI
ncbi:PaaI family thioesterase [candidate division WOR-3 bacterium]|uniref:Acyl-coenzyme A thioesterase THEM4 n=1 Tax=candidate division WOR-3 bacterium TaxID=2052148 RepID=A0A660SGG6_UNCW3|nr:MAG: PaaI family thioesterase [candidate division WOR-3 bacterium]